MDPLLASRVSEAAGMPYFQRYPAILKDMDRLIPKRKFWAKPVYKEEVAKMKRKVLALILGMILIMTCIPVHAEFEGAHAQTSDPVRTPTPQFEALESTNTPEAQPTEAPLDGEFEEPTEAPADEGFEAAPTEEPEPEAPAKTPGVKDPAEESKATAKPEQKNPSGETVQEPTKVAKPAPTKEPFKAKVKIELENKGQIYFGDKVTIKVDVKEANADYTVRWEYYNKEADVKHGENPWVLLHKGEKLELRVNEENAVLTYRIWVNDLLVAKEYRLPSVLPRPTEEPKGSVDEPEEPVDEPEEPVEESEEPTDEPEEPVEESEEPADEPEESVEESEEPADEPEEPVEGPEEPADEPVEEPEEPEESVKEPEEGEEAEQPVLNPERSIEVHAEWEGDLHYGDVVTMVADMNGYDNVDYVLQWQTSKDGENWADVSGETGDRLEMIVTEENSQDFWRVIAVVTGIMPEDALA